MSSGRVAVHTLTIECGDAATLAAFWAALLDYVEAPHPTASVLIEHPDGSGPRLLFQPSDRRKTDKNRLHFDLRPDDRHAAVERALGLGATRVDIGQAGDESWIVLADPEGNEFCILGSLDGTS